MDPNTLLKFEDFVTKFTYKSLPVEGLSGNKLISKGKVTGSQGERMVKQILERDLHLKYGIDYFTEHVFDNMGRNLRFDFYIKSHSLLIEFDGDQHYSGSRFHKTRSDWIEAIKRDEIKNKYCEENLYSLLRIPQVYSRYPDKLRRLIVQFFERVDNEGFVIEVDLYFKLKAGMITI